MVAGMRSIENLDDSDPNRPRNKLPVEVLKEGVAEQNDDIKQHQDNLNKQKIIQVTNDLMKKDLSFKYENPISLIFTLNVKQINILEICSNASNVEVYVNSEYKTTVKTMSADIIVIDGELELKFFTKEPILDIKYILVDGEDIGNLLRESSEIEVKDKTLEIQNLSDQLHFLDLKMDIKLSKIQSLLENLLESRRF